MKKFRDKNRLSCRQRQVYKYSQKVLKYPSSWILQVFGELPTCSNFKPTKYFFCKFFLHIYIVIHELSNILVCTNLKPKKVGLFVFVVTVKWSRISSGCRFSYTYNKLKEKLSWGYFLPKILLGDETKTYAYSTM